MASARHEKDTRTPKRHRITASGGHCRQRTDTMFSLFRGRKGHLTSAYTLAPGSVRIPPPPRAVRMHTCRSERCWRGTDTSQDTAEPRKTLDTSPSSPCIHYSFADSPFSASAFPSGTPSGPRRPGRLCCARSLPVAKQSSNCWPLPPRALPSGLPPTSPPARRSPKVLHPAQRRCRSPRKDTG
jgi:hypothetical protein